jgi:hypothetical protein
MLGLADMVALAAIVAIAAACAGTAPSSAPPVTPPPAPTTAPQGLATSACPTTCTFTLTGTGFYKEQTVDPLEGQTDFTGQGCIGQATNWQLTSCSGTGAAALQIGQVNETYAGVSGSTSDGCAFNPDPNLSFDVDPANTSGRPSGAINVHGLSYAGPLEVTSGYGPQGLTISSMRSTTKGQVTCISSRETAGGGIIGVPLMADFTCGRESEVPPYAPSNMPGRWMPGPVLPALTDPSKGQYSAKFECYYGPTLEGLGSVDVEIFAR